MLVLLHFIFTSRRMLLYSPILSKKIKRPFIPTPLKSLISQFQKLELLIWNWSYNAKCYCINKSTNAITQTIKKKVMTLITVVDFVF